MKKYALIFITICLALSLVGCTSGAPVADETTAPVQPNKPTEALTQNDVTESGSATASDVSALASEAKDKIKFTSSLEDQGDAPIYTYSMDSLVTSAAGWCAMSGVEQIAVFKVADGKTAEAEEKAKAYIDYLIDGYSSYGPAEVPKLKKAVVKTYVDILVVCISDDGNMQKTLDGIFAK